MLRNRKGISPLIATVLLIGFTIVLAVLVITWIQGTVKEETDRTDLLVDKNNQCLELVGGYSESFSYGAGMYTMKLSSKRNIEFSARVLWLDSSGVIGHQSNQTIPKYGSVNFNSNAVSEGHYTKAKVIISVFVDGQPSDCGSDEVEIQLGVSSPTFSPNNNLCEISLGETCVVSQGDCVGVVVDCNPTICVTDYSGGSSCLSSAHACTGWNGVGECLFSSCSSTEVHDSTGDSDCGAGEVCCIPIPIASCGSGTCDSSNGESCFNCISDCESEQANCASGSICENFNDDGLSIPSCMMICGVGGATNGRCFDTQGTCPLSSYPSYQPSALGCDQGTPTCCTP